MKSCHRNARDSHTQFQSSQHQQLRSAPSLICRVAVRDWVTPSWAKVNISKKCSQIALKLSLLGTRTPPQASPDYHKLCYHPMHHYSCYALVWTEGAAPYSGRVQRNISAKSAKIDHFLVVNTSLSPGRLIRWRSPCNGIEAVVRTSVSLGPKGSIEFAVGAN